MGEATLPSGDSAEPHCVVGEEASLPSPHRAPRGTGDTHRSWSRGSGLGGAGRCWARGECWARAGAAWRGLSHRKAHGCPSSGGSGGPAPAPLPTLRSRCRDRQRQTTVSGHGDGRVERNGSSLVGVEWGREREREVSGSMGGTWGRQDQSPGSSQPLIAKRHRMRPYTHSPNQNQIMDFKFLPRGSGVTARQSRTAAGSRSSPPRGSPSPESVQESEAGGGDIMQ